MFLLLLLRGGISAAGCFITAVLLSVALFPAARFSDILDRGGSAIVALYLIYTGIGTVRTRLCPAKT